MLLSTSWTRTKTLISAKSWTYYYLKNNDNPTYIIITGSTNHQLVCNIKDADATDFEDNYRSGATEVASTWDAVSYLVTF